MSPVPARRAPASQPPAVEGVNFGDLSFYTQGGGFPEGDYCLYFETQLFQAQTAQGVSRGPARLGVMVTAHSLTEAEEKPRTQFYSMGKNADKSYAPNAETGKGLIPVPGGPSSGPNNSTNWAIFLKSLYDAGLPQGVFTNDFTAIDGIHVHMQNTPEPEDRKAMRSATSEAQEEFKGSGMIAIVTEIKETGMPWEGTGGLEAPAPAAAAPVRRAPAAPAQAVGRVAVAAPKAVAKPLARKAPAPPPPPVEEVVEDGGVEGVAQQAVSALLEANPKGMSRLALKTGAFKAISLDENYGPDMATAVVDTYFVSDDALDSLIAPMGFSVQGTMVKVTG